MPSCLITGATGYIGSRAVPALIASGWEVYALVRDPARAPTGCTVVVDDGSAVGLAHLVAGIAPQVVIHLATFYIKDHQPHQIETLITANLTFGTRLLEAMSAANCRSLVCTGTAWQHLDLDDEHYRPATLYAATKQAFEDIARWYALARGLVVTALHLSDTYGPEDPRPKIFSLLSDAARTGRPLELTPGGQLLDPLHVDDAVAALNVAAVRLLAGEATGFEVFRVSPGQPVTLRQLVELWCQATGFTPDLRWGARSYREHEVMRPWLGGRTLPGWSPSVTLAVGLAGLR